MLSKTSASLSAKYLNRAGISAEYKDEVNFGVALMAICANEFAINRRLDALIAKAHESNPPPKQPAIFNASGQAPTQPEKKT